MPRESNVEGTDQADRVQQCVAQRGGSGALCHLVGFVPEVALAPHPLEVWEFGVEREVPAPDVALRVEVIFQECWQFSVLKIASSPTASASGATFLTSRARHSGPVTTVVASR
jgi:hypothetical protein